MIRPGDTRPCRRARQRGFSLLEVVVAFSILVVSVSVVMRIMGNSARLAAVSNDYYEATRIAESKMAELKVFSKTGRFEDSGTIDGKFTWHAQAQVYDRLDHETDFSVDTDPQTLAPYIVYQLDVTVSWRGLADRKVSLNTLALHTQPEEGT
ncbi:MAG TPA: hypothetical protein DCZ13_02190 [Porticoccaceae bacterium]|nr:hypothetical protein [Porticoccaceae bacterium]